MKRLKTACGQNFFIDTKQLGLVLKYNWYLHKTKKNKYVRGYLKGAKSSARIYLHHLVYKKPGKGFEIDHVDRDGLNNTSSNLRVVTRSENNANKLSRGTFLCKKTGRYRARIEKNGIRYNLGRYPTERLAREKYLAAKKILYPFAHIKEKRDASIK